MENSSGENILTDVNNGCKDTHINGQTYNDTDYSNWNPTNHCTDDTVNTKYIDWNAFEEDGSRNFISENMNPSEIDQNGTFDQYENNGQYHSEPIQEWENPVSYNQCNINTGNGYNNKMSEGSWENKIETNNYQNENNKGYKSHGSRKFSDRKLNGRGNNNVNNGKIDSKKSAKPKSTYIPPEFEENDNLTIEVGLNFSKYDKINVTVSGMEVPKNITSFQDANLCDVLLTNLINSHYTTPTPIQKYALPIIMDGRDMIASAQTGSGKTAAFILPILNSLLRDPSELIVDLNHCEPQALIMSPTRELAIQICEVATRLSRSTRIECELLYGGTATYHQKQKILRGVHILVATPGRLIDFVNRGVITFSSLRYLVLDEADRMLDMGFQLDIERIFNHNTMVSSTERLTLMFSATLPHGVQQIAKTYLKSDYISVAVGEVGGACKDVTQTILKVDKFGKKKALLDLLNGIDDCQGTIVFVTQKRYADFIAAYLSEMNFPTTSIHGDREQHEREKALKDFKTQKMKILVATAVAARGLDIMGVTMVVNYDLPNTIEEYVHRIGRTGRLGNSGKAVSFYDPEYDRDIAPYLVNTLKLADQEIPEFLLQCGTVECESNQFNDIRKDVTVTSDVLADEPW